MGYSKLKSPPQKYKSSKPIQSRILGIDVLRGIAIVLMVLFHSAFDASAFKVISFVPKKFWYYAGSAIGSLFLFTAGISLGARWEQRGPFAFKVLCKRALQIFGLGLCLTGFSLLFMPRAPIWFGILHCIGLSLILSYPFLKLSFRYTLCGAAVFMGLGAWADSTSLSVHWFIWLGIDGPVGLNMGDYFPVFPWSAMMVIGVAVVQCGGLALFARVPTFVGSHFLQWLGRRSLWIYLIHQPIIFGLFYGLSKL